MAASDYQPSISLFSSGVRAQARMPYRSSEFEYLDTAVGDLADRVRALMDNWFVGLPATSRAQIRDRFRSAATGAHRGAFWEMYAHEARTRLGFVVTVDIGNDVRGERHPDFRLQRPPANGRQSTELQIEATVVVGDDVVGPSNRTRVQQLYDAIDRLENREFLVGVSLREVGPQTPGRRLVAQIDRWLAGLDPDRAIVDPLAARETTIAHAGWVLDLHGSPIRADMRHLEDFGGIGSMTEGLRKLQDIAPISKALRTKAGHGYELDGTPFVIAALCAGAFADERDVAQALLGRIEYRIALHGDDSIGEYQGGGLWLDDRCEPCNTRVSAVLTAFDLRPSGCAVVEPCLWTNPWAKHPLAHDALPWRRNAIQPDGTIVTHPATATAAEVLGLHPRWPAAS